MNVFSDKYRVDMVHFNSSVTSVQYRGPYSLQGYSRVAVVCLNGSNGSTSALGSSANNEFAIMVGNRSTLSAATLTTDASSLPGVLSSFTSLSCARLHIGNSAVTAFLNVEEIKLIYHTGTAAATNRITIDGTTFSIQANASVSDYQINASNATGFADQLSSAIRLFATHLELQNYVTSATAAQMTLRVRDTGLGSQKAGFDFYVNANEGATLQLEVRQKRKQGIIEFTPAQVAEVNNSFTDFAVRLNSTCTWADAKVICIVRECQFGATNTDVVRVR